MKWIIYVLALFLSTAAVCAQNSGSGVVVLKSPNDYQVLSISPNGKWACGNYSDFNASKYGFRWNLESDEIEMLDAAIESEAWSVSDNGIIAGMFSDTEYKSNHSATKLPGYYADGKWHRMELPSLIQVQGGYCYSVSPDGHYFAGVVDNGIDYLAVIWKDGRISRQLNTSGVAIPYAVSPDGQSAAGWLSFNDERKACYWGSDGSATILSSYASIWSTGRKFSPDGKKLLFWGGWDKQATDSPRLLCLYDVETKEIGSVAPTNGDNNFRFYDISNNCTLVGEESYRAYIHTNGQGQYVEDLMREYGLDPSKMGIYMMEGTDYYQLFRAQSISADDRVMAVLYYNDGKDENGSSSVSMQTMILKLNQALQQAPPVGVKASQLSDVNVARITWKAPLGVQHIKGYHVYRDGVRLTDSAVEEESYMDTQLPYGTYRYVVTALYEQGESEASDTVSVAICEKQIQMPTALFARQQGYNRLFIQWEKPLSNLINKGYTDENSANVQGFGVSQDDFSFECAIRFDAAEVAAYGNSLLKSVDFYPMNEGSSWKVNVYTHRTDGQLQLLATYPVSQALVYGKKNTVVFDAPLPLPEGDMLVAVQVHVQKASQNIVGMDFGKTVKGYSDLIRAEGESDFYSVSDAVGSSGVMYDTSWLIRAVLTPAEASADIDDVDHYVIVADGAEADTTREQSYSLGQLSPGEHQIGVRAVYADSRQSGTLSVPVVLTDKKELLKGIDDVQVENTGNTTITATWQQPLDMDSTWVSYAGEQPSDLGVMGPAENNYNLMAAAIYPAKMFRGYEGYEIRSVRFFPLSDAVYTLMLYNDDGQLCEVEAENYTIGQWNTVILPEPVRVEYGCNYTLVIDCFDVAPESYTIAVDTNSPVINYSDLYSEDGSAWMSFSDAAIYANWMMGLNLSAPEGLELPVKGYNVAIDGKGIFDGLTSATSISHDMGTADNQQHSIRVDVCYEAETIVKGKTTFFHISSTGIADSYVAQLQLRQGENQLVVDGCEVKTIRAIAANGIQQALVHGNTMDISTFAPGVYLLRIETEGKMLIRKIKIQ